MPQQVLRPASDFTWSQGAVIRGPKDAKRLALVFTGGDFGEGSTEVLDTLKAHGVPGSFFFTGGYLDKPAHQAPLHRIVAEGHYLGPHGDAHLLYCPWEDRNKTLVSQEEFTADLDKNIRELTGYGRAREQMRWWIPPYEWYNDQISAWALEAKTRLFNFTPGTLSHTDYTEDDARNYRNNDTIFRSIFDYEAKDEAGLNGFLLLSHVGAGAKRTEKFFRRLPELIAELKKRGYSFTRVDEMLAQAPEKPQ